MDQVFSKPFKTTPGVITFSSIGGVILLGITLKCCCYFICTPPSDTPKALPNKRVKGIKQMKRKSLGRVEGFANKVRQIPAISKFRNAARKWKFCLRIKPTQYTQPTHYDNATFLTWFNKRKMWIYNDYLQWLQHWNLEQPTEINFKMHSTMSKLWTGKPLREHFP